jgi:PAS domain S-box-containing protein
VPSKGGIVDFFWVLRSKKGGTASFFEFCWQSAPKLLLWGVFWKRKPSPPDPRKAAKGDGSLYFHAFAEASIPMLICAPQGAILQVNKAFTELLGYSSAELREKRVSEITHPDDLEDHKGRLTVLISGREDSMRAEKRYVKKDGSTVWGAISVAVAKDKKGKPAFLISQIRDITAERRTREKLMESEGRLQAILDNSEAVIYAKDLYGHYILVNKKFEQIFQLQRETIIGKTDDELFPIEMARRFMANDRTVAEEGRGIQVEEEAPHTDGIHTYVSLKFPLRNVRRQIVAVCGISTDITGRKQNERELQELNDRLVLANQELKQTQMALIQAEKLESIGRLAAGVAHEVKNPLALISLGIDYLQGINTAGDDNIPIIMEEMRQAVGRAEKIIHGMVDFSADRQLKMQKMNLNALIETAGRLVKHELIRHTIELNLQLEPDLPPIFGDEGKLEQIFVNLFINAIHAMETQGRGTLTVTTRTGTMELLDRDAGARTADHLRGGDAIVMIEIADTGTGIAPEIINKIFDPFFTTKPTGEGTGLGLSVVKKIVELHRGVIKVGNNPSGGALVRIILKAQSPTSKTSPVPLL